MNARPIPALAGFAVVALLASGQTTKISCQLLSSTKLVKKVQPVYPEAARQGKIEGKVSLRLIVGRDGSVKTIEVRSGHPLLVAAATKAVSEWYEPVLLNGTAVEIDTTVDIFFQLQKQPKKVPHRFTENQIAPCRLSLRPLRALC